VLEEVHVKLTQQQPKKVHLTPLCGLLHHATTGQYVTNKWISGNLPGDVLVLSVNRAPFTDGTRVNGVSNIVRTAQDCQDQCNFVSGCQGWTFCGKAGGCGTGCKDYHAKNGPGELPELPHEQLLVCLPAVVLHGWSLPALYGRVQTEAWPCTRTMLPLPLVHSCSQQQYAMPRRVLQAAASKLVGPVLLYADA
jgi:hypothetical protein